MSDEKLRLGGMALRNGLLVHGPTHWAAAVRTSSGDVKVASGRKPRLSGPLERVPGLRGPGPVRYLMNPRVGTHLSGEARRQAQADAPRLALVE